MLQDIESDNWKGQQWLYFLNILPEKIPLVKIKLLEDFILKSNNSSLISKWLIIAIKNKYKKAYPKVEIFLASNGKLSLILPIYKELTKTLCGKKQAVKFYDKSKNYYHSLSKREIEKVLDLNH